MRRLLVVALVLMLGNASVAFAEETLLTSATRIVQDLAKTQSAPMSAVRVNDRRGNAAQQTEPGLASSGLKKRTKVAIAIGIAAGFAAVAHTIDRRVENTTPSSLGTRQDK